MSTISRRDFLKQASIASAGLMLGGMGFSTKSYARIVGANDRIGVGVVGYSDRFRASLLPCFLDHKEKLNFDMIAVSDLWNMRREAAQQNLTQKLGHAVALYRNNEELYDDKNVDAVMISTADFQHALHAREAAEAGRHIYCEKPFAETMWDAREGRKAVERSGVVFQMGSQRRSGSNYHAANEFIRSGKFGDIVMCEMTWNVNQPGRWRRPGEVPRLREQDTDWRRFLLNRPYEDFDPRKYLEFRLFWPYSSGIPGQWMAHQIDTVHWFTGLHHPRSVAAGGGIYLWKDGRTNIDTMTAVLDYGPADDPGKGFQVQYSSRFTNGAGGTKEIYYSNGGELNLDTNMVTSNGYLTAREARAMGMNENKLADFKLEGVKVETGANTGGDPLTSAHMLNWMQCVRNGDTKTNAPVEAAYDHSVACIMVTAAMRTKQFVEFDEDRQEVIAGGRVFQY
jgi:predicted dehydrogenase